MDELHNILENLGVKDIAQDVCETLYSAGALSVVEIARKTGVHRTRVYQALKELERRALVVPIKKGKRTIYIAVPPEKLRDTLAALVAQIEIKMPILSSAYRGEDTKPKMTVREGRAGIESIFKDLVLGAKKDEVFLRASSERDTVRAQTYFPTEFRRLREKKGMERLVISAEKVWKGKKTPFSMGTKFIPSSAFPFDQNVIELVYRDTIAIIDLNTETAFVIEGAAIADFHRTLFRSLYQRL